MTDKPPRESKRPTIADVARVAGVAPAIVSRALSPDRRPVSLEKKERVLKAAAELGYHQNPLARGLATKSIDLVAVIINYLSDLSDLDLFDPLLEGIQSLGKQAILIRVGRTKRMDDFLRNSLTYHVHAALVFSDFADASEVRDLFHSDNVLMLNGRFDAESARIHIDEAIGIRDLVQHARGQGVGSAALVTGRASSLVEEARIAAYRSACSEAAIHLISEVGGDYSYASGCKAAATIAGTAPEAIFCTSDSMAMGVMDGLRSQGRRPPEDYLLYGFDAVEKGNFAAYDISSVGFDRAALVNGVLTYLRAPAEFPADGLDISTRFIARSTG